MGREEHLLSRNIEETLANARAEEWKLSKLIPLGSTSEEDPVEVSRREAETALRYLLEKLFRDIGILAERLNLPQFAKEVRDGFKAYDPNKLADLEAHPEEPEFASAPLSKAYSYYQSLASLSDSRWVTGLDVFKTILQNTPAIIRARGVNPDRESKVRNAVFDVMKLCFHDALREIPIGHLLKTYKPDLGVRSLKASAEYKFVRNEQELRTALDGIYADMKGYSGHHEWQTFFAVIYTTTPIAHKEKLEEEFRGVNAETNWTPIIVVGDGAEQKS